MWNLTEIKARNICTFTKLHYSMRQDVATLIFGNNEDDGENQQHNGSGKSAFMECIGFGITGENFRKVETIEDIIRDDEDYAEVQLTLYNKATRMTMDISRRIERGESQKVTVKVMREGEEYFQIPFVSVLDMNKKIFEMLGITKDDLYHNYLLNASRFKSFFSASDKEKKEIINTFSNGIIVDEAIEKLKVDMDSYEQENVCPAESEVSKIEGAIEAISSQIEEAENNQESEEQDRKDKIAELKEKIAANRSRIRDCQEIVGDLREKIEKLDELADTIEGYEKQDFSFAELYRRIYDRLESVHLEGRFSDWESKIKELNESKTNENERIKELQAEIAGVKSKMDASKKQLEEAGKEYNDLKANVDKENSVDNAEIEHTKGEISYCEDKIKELDSSIQENLKRISNLKQSIIKIEASISGAIECPKCHHKFSLDDGKSIGELQEELQESNDLIGKYECDNEKIESDKKANQYDITERNGAISRLQKKQRERADSLHKLFTLGQDLRSAFNGNLNAYNSLEEKINKSANKVSYIENEISRSQSSMITESIDIIDDEIDKLEGDLKVNRASISSGRSTIEVYEKSIEELESISVTDHVDKLKATLKEKEAIKKEADDRLAAVKAELNELKEQESRFISFKTHLANTKISSISQITNKVLQDIKSPMRVKLTGYTTTKTGKVRDKIYVSVIKDGIDCGSFLKCSAGERARIIFANIVAMQRMTNLTSQSGGLNLICIDEIFDSCEEAGLMSVAEMANELGITVMMITQGKTEEGYPHKLTVTKRCGISTLDSDGKGA